MFISGWVNEMQLIFGKTQIQLLCLLLRHWKKLMELTEMNFDLNPETFTLQNMFAMELHRFTSIIQDIVTSATKELNIEKGINEVAETWSSMKFTIHKYMKGNTERGNILFIVGLFDGDLV